MAETPLAYTTLANELASKLNADILLYNGEIARHHDRTVAELCRQKKRRENIVLYLVTQGGNPDAAFRIARCFHELYAKFIVVIPGLCKSAGTIVAIGADEIAISDNGELGPLDVQMAKPDELWTNESGLNIEDALDSLKKRALGTLEDFLISLTLRSGSRIRTVTALETARDLVVGLYGKIYEQIDPISLGEASRAMQLATHYGGLLNAKSKNLKLDALDRLANKYPHHGFVIDRKEAESLFVNIRRTDDVENRLADAIGPSAVWPLPPEQLNGRPLICFLSDEIAAATEASNESQREKDSGRDTEKERATVSPIRGDLEGKDKSPIVELPKQARVKSD